MTVLVTSPRRHLRMPFAAALAVGAVVLAGCQSDAEPPVDRSSAASVTPSASPSSSSPTASPSPSVEIPAAAREKSEKGAEAFVRYFFDQVNVAWTEPRTGLIPPLSDPGCQFCLKTEADARRLVEERQRYRSDPIRLASLDVVSKGAPSGQTLVRTDARQNAVDVVTSDNGVARRDAEKQLRLMTGVVWKNGRWFVFEVEAL